MAEKKDKKEMVITGVPEVDEKLGGGIPVGSLVLLDTGELAITFDNNPAPRFRMRPKVKLITDSNGNKLDGEVVDLSRQDPDTKDFVRKIIKTLDAAKYQVRISDYFVAEAE